MSAGTDQLRDIDKSSRRKPLLLQGIGVSPGIVVARALVFQHQEIPIFRVPLLRQEVKPEVARVLEAKEETLRQLLEIKSRTVQALGEEHGYIFDAQMLMLDDPLLIDRITGIVRQERVNAEWAVKLAVEELASVFDSLNYNYYNKNI